MTTYYYKKWESKVKKILPDNAELIDIFPSVWDFVNIAFIYKLNNKQYYKEIKEQ